MVRVAINGFGRIGRLTLRAMRTAGVLGKEIEVVAVGDLVAAEHLAYLLKHDSTQGKFEGAVRSEASGAGPEHDVLVVDDRPIRVVSAESPAALPWRELGVDYVIESTGHYTDALKASAHLTAGAKKVIISAPSSNADLTVVVGVNHEDYHASRHHVVSNASCTTYALAPVVSVLLREGFGIVEGLMTSVHSYTAGQSLVDGPSRKDWKGGRAGAVNIIPASTGAAKAIGTVIPQVKGKLTGIALRVPTPAVSVVDFTVRLERDAQLADITAAMKRASDSYLRGVLGCTDEQVVSSDFLHDPRSSIFDAGSSVQLNPRFMKLVAWYDNEWAYANRCMDLLRYMAGSASYANGISATAQVSAG